MLDRRHVIAVLTRCGLGMVWEDDGLLAFASSWGPRYSGEPITVDLGEERISEQRLSDALEAQGIPLAIAEDAMLQTRQNPP